MHDVSTVVAQEEIFIHVYICLCCCICVLCRFISQLLTLLVCPNEQTSLQIRNGVKESLGVDLSPALFKPFFTLVKATRSCFFLDGQVRE